MGRSMLGQRSVQCQLGGEKCNATADHYEALERRYPQGAARKAAPGAERGSLEPGHASLPGLVGRQLAAGIGGQSRLTITCVARRVSRSSSREVP